MVAISDNEEVEFEDKGESEAEGVSEADDIDKQVHDASFDLQDENLAPDQETDLVELPQPVPIVRIVQSDSQRPHRERKRRRDEDEYVYSKRSK